MNSTSTLFGFKFSGIENADHCRTPQWLFEALDMEFAFDLDPCPLELLPSCDGLEMDWNGKRVFCNPPYSNIEPWVQKAVNSKALVVFVVPCRFDSKWCRILREANSQFRFFARNFTFVAQDGTKHHPIGRAMVAVLNRLYEPSQ